MKKVSLLVLATALLTALFSLSSMDNDSKAAQSQPQLRQSVEVKFEEYRKAIKDAHQVDIKNFKDRIPGGHADGKPVLSYDLKQLIIGINFERDHTKDDLLALELAMDHLERIPDYYTRLDRMYWDCQAEKLRNM